MQLTVIRAPSAMQEQRKPIFGADAHSQAWHFEGRGVQANATCPGPCDSSLQY